ncbi:crotonase/enoyl-CoA hydratase family protein [Aquibium sp. LZ166]|uniref:Crotonase/enoyl-CoA hydratase family protein n=1 Tax=Aquibium pacificus TaxID=3153579 RepID=A0ABV3SM30_9HYPH
MAEVEIEIAGRVMVVAINRTEARNAANRAVAVAIAEAVDALDERDDLSAGVITGRGGTFCAGMDLKAFLRGELARVEGRGFAGLTERLPSKPLIAAVEGHALAGGFELALACDLIVAAEDARFGLPEVKRGLVANAGGLMRLPRQLPFRMAMELVLTGEQVKAGDLHRLGLINRLVPNGGALAAALALAETIAQNGPMALAVSKRVMLESQDWPSTEMFQRQRQITAPVFASADAREGALAFAEKRKPNWQGR